MTAKEMWDSFNHLEKEKLSYEAWAFGGQEFADELAALVLSGDKKATASAYPLYELEGETLPETNEYSVILNAKDQAVCIIRTTKVYVQPFHQVSEQHAFMEGEGDKSLAYWRKVHQDFFTKELKEVGMEFTEEMLVVCEEFEVVWR